uniref:Glutathione peroxidase n=2 Tax=Timema TaxID=61471 RepID=A0A7R9F448_9NEOP|nr:unnamed protein product [Timema bartmani]
MITEVALPLLPQPPARHSYASSTACVALPCLPTRLCGTPLPPHPPVQHSYATSPACVALPCLLNHLRGTPMPPHLPVQHSPASSPACAALPCLLNHLCNTTLPPQTPAWHYMKNKYRLDLHSDIRVKLSSLQPDLQEVMGIKRRGHVCIIVNVASKCGLTATNYKELVELHEKYGETKGLKILGFPCNQFSGQEPGSSEDIVCFAVERKVKFDLFEKVDVNGDNAHPLWKYLKHKKGGTLGEEEHSSQYTLVSLGQRGTLFTIYTGVTGQRGTQFTIYTAATGQRGTQFTLYTDVTGQRGTQFTPYTDVTGQRGTQFTPYTDVTGQRGTQFTLYTDVTGQRGTQFTPYTDVTGQRGTQFTLYTFVTGQRGIHFIKWNFTKFIIDKNGQPVERHGPKTDPSKLVSSLEKYW